MAGVAVGAGVAAGARVVVAGTGSAAFSTFSKFNPFSIDFDLNSAYVDFLSSSVDLDFLKFARSAALVAVGGFFKSPVDFLKLRRTRNHEKSRVLFILFPVLAWKKKA